MSEQTAVMIRTGRRPLPEGRVRSCRHDSHHPHGSEGRYRLDRCHCLVCRAGNAERQRKGCGATPSDFLVDTAPARAHIQDLLRGGLTYKQIAEQAGVGFASVRRIWPDGARTGQLKQYATQSVSDAILGVTVEAAQRRIPPRQQFLLVGARRRLQALICIGWPVEGAIVQRTGITHQHIFRILKDEGVWLRPDTHQRIVDLYNELWDKKPPSDTPEQRRILTRTLNLAKKHGYVPPMAWDDIDDPDAVPDKLAIRCEIADCYSAVWARGLCNMHYKRKTRGDNLHPSHGLQGGRPSSSEVDELMVDAFLDGHHVTLSHADAVEVIRRLLQRGHHSHTEIAERVGTTTRTVARISAEQREAA